MDRYRALRTAMAAALLALPATGAGGGCEVRVDVASIGAEDGRVWEVVFQLWVAGAPARGAFRFELAFVDGMGELQRLERGQRWESEGAPRLLSVYQFLLNPGETVQSVRVRPDSLSCDSS